ncbi:O-antigen ligase family protein [bacterium]|nr:O-antigen ligase family protein [bacterium]
MDKGGRRIGREMFHILFPAFFLYLALDGGGWRLFPKTVAIVVVSGAYLLWVNREKLVFSKLFIPLLILLGYSFFSIFVSVNPSSTVEQFLNYFGYFLIYILLFNYTRETGKLRELLRFSVLFSLPVVVIGYLFYIQNMLGLIVTSHDMPGYFIGTFYWKNPMAGYLLFVIPISFFLYLTEEKKLWRYVEFIVAVLSLVGFVLTRSRGGWVSLAAASIMGLLVYLRLGYRRKDLRRVAVLLVVSAALVPLFIAPRMIVKQASSLKEVSRVEQVRSFEERKLMGDMALRVFSDFKLFGVGLGGFESVYPSYLKSSSYLSTNVHNQYLQAAAEGGIVGLLLFILMIISILWGVFRSCFIISDEKKYLTLAVFMSTLAFSLHIMFDFSFSFSALSYLFFGLAGATAGSVPYSEKKLKPPVVTLLAVLSVLVTIASTLALTADTSFREAREYLRKRNLLFAKSKLSLAVMLNPLNADYRIEKANYLSTIGKDNEALSQLNVAENLSPFSPAVHLVRSRIYEKKDSLEQAIRSLERAISLAPFSRPDQYNKLAYLYAKAGREKEAKKTYEEALRKFSSRPDEKYSQQTVSFRYYIAQTHLALADILNEEGKYHEAEEHRKLGELLGKPRKEDILAAKLGFDTYTPEYTVATIFSAISRLDTTALDTLLLEKKSLTWMMNGEDSVRVLRIVNVDYDILSSFSDVIYILRWYHKDGSFEDSLGQMRFTLRGGRWRGIFNE